MDFAVAVEEDAEAEALVRALMGRGWRGWRVSWAYVILLRLAARRGVEIGRELGGELQVFVRRQREASRRFRASHRFER
ncbi:MAG: hypothetical protein AB1938_25605 [Myxococcota bacterium]